MDICCLRISIAECSCMDIRAWISMWISTLVWIIEDLHQKIMDIHVDIRGFLEIHAWVCYEFSDQGGCIAAANLSPHQHISHQPPPSLIPSECRQPQHTGV